MNQVNTNPSVRSDRKSGRNAQNFIVGKKSLEIFVQKADQVSAPAGLIGFALFFLSFKLLKL